MSSFIRYIALFKASPELVSEIKDAFKSIVDWSGLYRASFEPADPVLSSENQDYNYSLLIDFRSDAAYAAFQQNKEFSGIIDKLKAADKLAVVSTRLQAKTEEKQDVVDTSVDRWTSMWEAPEQGWNAEKAQQQHEKNYAYIMEQIKADGGSIHDCYVPLCGDAPIVSYLSDKGHNVTGAEFVLKAVESLLKSLGAGSARQFASSPYQPAEGDGKKSHPIIQHVSAGAAGRGSARVLQGDFFSFSPSTVFDFIYDRGSLVAITHDLRGKYTDIIKKALKPGGYIFLECVDRAVSPDANLMAGPPHHLPLSVVQQLYPTDQFKLIHAQETIPTRFGQMQRIILKKL